jgi:hypothetical protein
MKMIFALVAVGFAVACTHPTDRANVPTFGQAVGSNQERQIVPGEADAAPPEGSGSQGALAQSRYRTGMTKPLLPSSSSIANPSTAN